MTLTRNRRSTLAPLAVVALLLGALLMSACNTAQGFGRDVKSAGQWIEESTETE